MPTPRAGRLLAIGASLAGFAALYAAVRNDRSRAIDLALTLRIQARRSRALHAIMRAASWPGFPPQSRLIPSAVIVAWLVAGRPRTSVFQVGAWGGAALATAVKAVVRRPRPLPPQVMVAIAPLGGTSFPSGHVLTYVTFYGFLGYAAATHVRSDLPRRAIMGTVGSLILLVGPSRIEQGHHWPTDTTASYLLGLAYLLGLVLLYERRPTAPARPSPPAPP